jgi:hypothetical protein
MTYYLRCALLPSGTATSISAVQVVTVRAEATEFLRDDSKLVQNEAKKKWREVEWKIDRTYRGKYVVHGETDG